MRSEEAIKRAIEEIDDKVRGSCPYDPFYAACEPEAVVEALLWVLGETDTIEIETDEGDFTVGRDGAVKADLFFTDEDEDCED